MFLVSSLYPSVLKYYPFPKGHPVIITKDFKPVDEYFGIIKCKVLPPRKLNHPVLPRTSQGKLKFPLCQKCADSESYPCSCSPDERALVGCWVSPEILKAVEKGYKILKIYEVYHWPETCQYGDETNGLFTDYINTFLKVSVFHDQQILQKILQMIQNYLVV